MTVYKRGPAFLGIGPPKTATTWLYSVLSVHPEIRLPPMKEIGYLWQKRFLPKRHYASLFFDNHWYYRDRRQYLRNSFLQHAKSLTGGRFNSEKFLWDMKYAFLPHTDSWYAGLFSTQFVSGDITPKYSELIEPDLQQLRNDFGNLKIIITLRDPVEREWSRAKMNLCTKQQRQPQEISDEEWISHFGNVEQSKANDYATLISLWWNIFGRENVCIIFFDEVVADGWTAFQKVCAFLGIGSPPESLREQASSPVNVGSTSSIPRKLREYLFLKHREKMHKLANSFPDVPYPIQWLESNEAKVSAG